MEKENVTAHTLSKSRLERWLMHDQSFGDGQRESLGLPGGSAAFDQRPHVVLV